MARTKEEKRFLFNKLAVRRVNVLLHQMGLIANLSNKANYEYTDDQYKKIFTALRTRIDKCENEFAVKQPERFTLD
tara:strand:- start:793 stop:1020 length:228 start_codon:yes stop_codon:yes gene_type:complete